MTGRILRAVFTPFGLATLACLVLAGWASWSAGILDGPVAADVRTSSVYAAPGSGLDERAAERVVGNRRLVVVMLAPGSDVDGCDQVRHAAAGTIVLWLSRDGDDYDTYSCLLVHGADDENFGKAFVSEETISNGVDAFLDRPLDAVKVVAVNYDTMVQAGILPAGARTISPSLPRYLIAAGALAGVLVGSALVFATARRAGRVAAAVQSRRERAADDRTVLSAAAAGVARQIIDLDREFTDAKLAAAKAAKRDGPLRGEAADYRRRAAEYRRLAGEYARLLDDVADADRGGGTDVAALTARAESLADDLRALAT